MQPVATGRKSGPFIDGVGAGPRGVGVKPLLTPRAGSRDLET
jgi:hypothetical protein